MVPFSLFYFRDSVYLDILLFAVGIYLLQTLSFSVGTFDRMTFV